MNSAVIFMFGATGDLARRKLYPALYSMYQEGKLSERFAVIGLARRPRTNEQFRDDVRRSIDEFSRSKVSDEPGWARFVERFEYLSLDSTSLPGFQELGKMADRMDKKFDVGGNRLFYLALAPELFGTVAVNLRDGGLLDTNGWHRVVIEKPFGYNLPSAQQLNKQITEVFDESEIFRIDHYLGKEMVQNIGVIRFANALFEPLWNNRHIANIQITLSETVGVEERGGYYDHSGALRDMGQNHMLQVLAMLTMEPPSRMHPEDIRDEKVKVLRSLRPYASTEDVDKYVVRGQYGPGELKGAALPGYRQEDKVDPESKTETYFAAKLMVDNFRWAGVPFYLRTGKRLPAKTSEVVVEFKNVPDNVYLAGKHQLEPNLLAFRIQPQEGAYLKINGREPGSESSIVPLSLDLHPSGGHSTPEAYERLLYDAVRGDSTYFTRWDEVASAWQFIDRIAEGWTGSAASLQSYAAGSWGPKAADELLAQDGFKWWPVNGQNAGEPKW